MVSHHTKFKMPSINSSLVEPESHIVLKMEAESASKTVANVYQTTQRNNQEYSHLHIRRHENLKPRILNMTYYLQNMKKLSIRTFCMMLPTNCLL
jgi:hypothetical protein